VAQFAARIFTVAVLSVAMCVSALAQDAHATVDALVKRDGFASWMRIAELASGKDRALRLEAIRALGGIGRNYLHVFSGTDVSRDYLKDQDETNAEISRLQKLVADGHTGRPSMDQLRDLIYRLQGQSSQAAKLKKLDRQFSVATRKALEKSLRSPDIVEAREALHTVAKVAGDYDSVTIGSVVVEYPEPLLRSRLAMADTLGQAARFRPALLIQELETDDLDRKAVIARALAEARVRDASEALKRLVNSDDPRHRAIGYEVLAVFQRPEHLQLLIAHLVEPDDAWNLTRLIARYGPAAAREARKQLRSLDPVGRARAAEMAGFVGGNDAAKLLLDLLRDGSQNVVVSALEALARFPLDGVSNQTGSAILKMLQDLVQSPSTEMSKAAVNAMRNFVSD
jgi:hypothetical protein